MADLFAPAVMRHRLVDRGTKLAGLGLLVAALEIGIASTTGVALAIAGVALGVCTVFFERDQS